MEIACVPAEALLGDSRPSEDVIQLLEEVEVIFGRDIATQDVFLIHGRELLKAVVSDRTGNAVDVLIIEVDRQSGILNRVLALVQIAKRGCDYIESPLPSR